MGHFVEEYEDDQYERVWQRALHTIYNDIRVINGVGR